MGLIGRAGAEHPLRLKPDARSSPVTAADGRRNTDLRTATKRSRSPLTTEPVHTVLTDGSYRRHMERVRDRLDQARARTIQRLKGAGVMPWIDPVAGLFV